MISETQVLTDTHAPSDTHTLPDTHAFFLHCLADFIKEVPTAQRSDVDWAEAFALAKKQNMEGILYYQCREWMPIQVKRRNLMPYLSCAVQSSARETAVNELIRHAEKEGTPLLFLKGTVFRDLYPLPALRSMGDIDCLVQESDRLTIDQILRQKMGFDRFIDNHAVWTYYKGPVFVEVHTHMFYEYLANDVDYRRFFDQIWQRCHSAPVYGHHSDLLYVPDEEYHFLYLMAHTAKHLTNKGSGFRPYLDMALFAKRYKDRTGWQRIEQQLEKLQLLDFTRICFSLCEHWFDVKMPLKSACLNEAFYKKATAKTFRDGVFGLENEENEAAYSAKEMKRSRLPYPLTALRLTWKKLFPPYEDMQLVPWYSFVDRKPWLMPAAWIYRWLYCLKHKPKSGACLLAEPITKNKTIAAREKWLQQWKL